jgi:hypothetical protein
MPAGSSSVCVDDSENAVISANCNDAGEVIVPCPGSNAGFGCTVINSTLFEVSSLSHSTIGTYTLAVTPQVQEVSSGGGCIPSWSCTEWSPCSASETQTRTCIKIIDPHRCNVKLTSKPAESQKCALPVVQPVTPPKTKEVTQPQPQEEKPAVIEENKMMWLFYVCVALFAIILVSILMNYQRKNTHLKKHKLNIKKKVKRLRKRIVKKAKR